MAMLRGELSLWPPHHGDEGWRCADCDDPVELGNTCTVHLTMSLWLTIHHLKPRTLTDHDITFGSFWWIHLRVRLAMIALSNGGGSMAKFRRVCKYIWAMIHMIRIIGNDWKLLMNTVHDCRESFLIYKFRRYMVHHCYHPWSVDESM